MGAMFNSALAALGSLVAFAPAAAPIRYPYASEWEALQSDWSRIGSDMSTVIERESGDVKKANTSARSKA